MMMQPALTTGMRNALFSLNDLQGTIEKTNYRLATGRKVNSALDSALNYFTADGLNNRASALTNILDTIGLGIKVHQAADKGLTSIKSLLETAEGQIRGALQLSSQNNKAVSAYSFASASANFLDAAGSTDKTRLGAADTLAIQLTTTNTSTGAITNLGAAVAITTAGQTVQQVIDNINNNATLNPTGQALRVRAYLNDLNQLVVESAGGDDPTAVIGFQLNIDASADVDSLISDVFTYTGQTNATVTYTGTAATAQTAVVRTDVNQARKATAANFREVLQQITNTAMDAGYNGTNLLNGDSLKVYFNELNTTSITTRGVRYNSSGLGFVTDNVTSSIGDARYAFQSDHEIQAALAKVRAAKSLVEAQSRSIASNFSMIQNRLDFTKENVKTLKEGSDLLTLADMNEEGANLAALQTRQQLSVTALSLSNQSDQAILRLF